MPHRPRVNIHEAHRPTLLMKSALTFFLNIPINEAAQPHFYPCSCFCCKETVRSYRKISDLCTQHAVDLLGLTVKTSQTASHHWCVARPTTGWIRSRGSTRRQSKRTATARYGRMEQAESDVLLAVLAPLILCSTYTLSACGAGRQRSDGRWDQPNCWSSCDCCGALECFLVGLLSMLGFATVAFCPGVVL